MIPSVAQSSTCQPTPPKANAGLQVLGGIYKVGSSAAFGALAAYAFTIINPIGGAIFGATSALCGVIADKISEQIPVDKTALKIAVWALGFAASIAIGLLVTTAVGFPLTVVGAIGMTAAMFATSIVVHLVAGVVFCSSCIGLLCAGLAGIAGIAALVNANNNTTATSQ